MKSVLATFALLIVAASAEAQCYSCNQPLVVQSYFAPQAFVAPVYQPLVVQQVVQPVYAQPLVLSQAAYVQPLVQRQFVAVRSSFVQPVFQRQVIVQRNFVQRQFVRSFSFSSQRLIVR